MLTLLTYPKNGVVFSLSPFCVKAALLLDFANETWQREDLNDPRKMPHGKLPVLRAGDQLIPDSQNIRRYLEQKGTDFDPGLSSQEKAQAQAYIRMAEDSLYFHIVEDRWNNDLVWPTIRDNYFEEIPALIRRPVTNAIRKSVKQGLRFQGIDRFGNAERMERLDDQLRSISELVQERGFLMGARVSSADLSVAPMIQALGTTMVQTPSVLRVLTDSVLTGYVERVLQEVSVSYSSAGFVREAA